MHSRIFQVSRQKIEKDEYYDAERYYSGEHEGFAGDYSEVADYVDEDTDRISDIKWLSQYLVGSVEFLSEDSFKIINKNKYFDDKYINFRQAVEGVQNITKEEYINDQTKSGIMLDHLEQSYSEKFGFYIDEYNQKNYYTDFFGPLDDFMRRVQDGEVYYIGATIDYHC